MITDEWMRLQVRPPVDLPEEQVVVVQFFNGEGALNEDFAVADDEVCED